jgi:hypothetical protein
VTGVKDVGVNGEEGRNEGRRGRSAGRERRVGDQTVKSGGKPGEGWHSEGREMVRE